MMKMKKWLSVILAGTLLTMAIGASTVCAEGLDTETPITLSVYGPGIFGASGIDGSMNTVTGEKTMGYQVVIDRWNELYPNITLNLEGIGWDSWQAAVQAAVLGEGLDVMCHGGSLTALCEPLEPYLEQDQELADTLYSLAKLRTDQLEGYTMETPVLAAIPYNIGPSVMILDKQIFDDYGVELPDATWTWADVASLASQLTGTDPVSGKQTYGYLMRSGSDIQKNNTMICMAYDIPLITYGATEKDCTINFQTEDMKKAWQMIADLAKSCSPDNIEGIKKDLVISPDNDTAMGWTEEPINMINMIKVQGLEDRFALLPMPVIEKGEDAGSPSTYVGNNNLAISNRSEHKDWAWEFIKFVLTDEVVQEYLLDNGAILNTSAGIEKLEEKIGGDYAKVLQSILETIPKELNPGATAYNSTTFGFNTSVTNAMTELIKGSVTVDEALAIAQEGVDEYFAGLE